MSILKHVNDIVNQSNKKEKFITDSIFEEKAKIIQSEGKILGALSDELTPSGLVALNEMAVFYTWVQEEKKQKNDDDTDELNAIKKILRELYESVKEMTPSTKKIMELLVEEKVYDFIERIDSINDINKDTFMHFFIDNMDILEEGKLYTLTFFEKVQQKVSKFNSNDNSEFNSNDNLKSTIKFKKISKTQMEKCIKEKKWDELFNVLKNNICNETLDPSIIYSSIPNYLSEYKAPVYIKYAYNVIKKYIIKMNFNSLDLNKFNLKYPINDIHVKLFIIFVEVRREFYNYLFKYFNKRFNKTFINETDIKKANKIIDSFLKEVSIKQFGKNRAFSDNSTDKDFIDKTKDLIKERDIRLISKHNLEYTYVRDLIGITKNDIKDNELPRRGLFDKTDYSTYTKERINNIIYGEVTHNWSAKMDTDMEIYYAVKEMFGVEEEGDNHLYMNLPNEEKIYDELYYELFPEYKKDKEDNDEEVEIEEEKPKLKHVKNSVINKTHYTSYYFGGHRTKVASETEHAIDVIVSISIIIVLIVFLIAILASIFE